jgi:hypothetical protein
MVDENDLFQQLQERLNEIPIKELHKIFGAWINRLLEEVQMDGDYIF